MKAGKIEVRGLESLKKKMAKLGQAFSGASLAEAAMDGAFILQRHVQQEANEFTETGDYKNSIQARLDSSTDTKAVASVGTNKPQAMAKEYGSGIHAESGAKTAYTIEPDEKKFLAFEWDDAPDWLPRLDDGRVLLRKVSHPGVEAKPHFRPGYEKGKVPARNAVKLSLQNTIKETLR